MVLDIDIDLIDKKELNTEEKALTANKVWKNSDNNDFYEGISIDTFVTNSILGGLEEGCDLNLISNYIFNANSLLEVGAGYGRVINYLIKHNFAGNITAIERSKKCLNLLARKFGDKISILNMDLKHLQIESKFDLILWMFSGISDFARDEQLPILAKLKSSLKKDGKIILDTFLHSAKPANAVIASSQSYIITEDNKKLYGYIPSPEEIDSYAKQLGFNKTEHFHYETTTKSKRMLHILL